MTVNFKWLKEHHPHLKDDEIIRTLIEFDDLFFKVWLVYNKYLNPTKKLEECVIDLPTSFFDEINNRLQKK